MANRRINNNDDLWLIDVARGIPRRFVSDPASDTYPLWSPDGARLAFGSSRRHGSVVHDLFVKPISGTGSETVLLESAENKNSLDWSRDRRFIVYAVLSAKTGADLWVLPLEKSAKPFAFTQAPGDEIGAKFSPDGHWMTYQSNETGRVEIYVQRFPGPARSTLISTSGGTTPAWRDDGREIIYKGLDDRVMAVPVSIRRRQRERWHTGRALRATTGRNIQRDSGRQTFSCQHVARRRRVSPDHRRVELEGIQSIVSPP